ncbi:DMT family transporter [Patescibacteria group bacterium]
MRVRSKETTGEIFMMISAALHGFFPLLANTGVNYLPPVFFAGMSVLLSSVLFFIFLIYTGNFRKIFNKKALPYILGVTVLVVIIPSILIFIGTSMTSGVNTAILLQTEVLFTFIVFGLFFKEKITTKKLLGGLAIIGGATIILYNGSFSLNWGDFMIILATFFYPFGNRCAKKALEIVPSSVILFVRSLIGGTFLVVISLLFEKHIGFGGDSMLIPVLFVLANGFLIMFLSKIVTYEAFKRIDVTKAIALVMSEPAFALIFLMIFLQQFPNLYQVIGLIIIMIGVGFVVFKKRKAKDLEGIAVD